MHGTGFVGLVVASTLIDAGVAAAVLFFRSRQVDDDNLAAVIDVRRVFFAVLATAAVFICKLPVWVCLGVSAFGGICLTYVDLVILVPLLCGIALISPRLDRLPRFRHRPTRTVRLLAVLGLLPLPAGMYATFVEPFRLQLETAEVVVDQAREGRTPIRIGVLADIQTGAVTDYERDAIDDLMAMKPDIVLIPGDLFQGTPEAFHKQTPALRNLLSRLTAPAGAFLVVGNIDRQEAIRELVAETHVRLLLNETVRLTVGDRRVTIGGVEMARHPTESRRVMRELHSAPGDDDIRILMTHYPDAVLQLPSQSRIDLVVAGHTHGGQVCLPFWGPPITASDVPRAIAAGGLHTYDLNTIYVSRGLGCERGQAPRIRFLSPPEVTLLTVGRE